MSKDQYIERLRAVPLFAGLNKKELAALLQAADHLRYPPRYRIVREGAAGEEFWMVLEGSLAVHRGGAQVDTIQPGDFFGELAVIDPAPRDATIITQTPAELLVVGRQRFWGLLESSPTLSRKVVTALARRLRESDARDSARLAAERPVSA